MKYKKYLLALFIFLFIGFNKAYAEECYYISNGLSAKYNTANNKVSVNKYANVLKPKGNGESILNLTRKKKINEYEIPAYNNTKSCPGYLILHYDTNVHEYKGLFKGLWVTKPHSIEIYATDDQNIAQQTADAIGTKKEHYGFYASLKPNMTEEGYYKEYASNGNGTAVPNYYHEEVQDCESLFGDKNNPDSIAYLIDEVLNYVRIIVPILVIILGMLDLAKAVVAGNPDEMKKAQKRFIRRLIAGVAVFFVPLLVDLVMGLADIVWEGLGYSTCSL